MVGVGYPTPKLTMALEELDQLILKLAHWLGYRVWQRFPNTFQVYINYSIEPIEQSCLRIYLYQNHNYMGYDRQLLQELSSYLKISSLIHYTHLKNKMVVVTPPSAHQMLAAEQEFEDWLHECRAQAADPTVNKSYLQFES